MPGQVYEYELKDIQLQLPGKHNVENAIAAIVVASSLGAKPEKIKAAIKDFKGVKEDTIYMLKVSMCILMIMPTTLKKLKQH